MILKAWFWLEYFDLNAMPCPWLECSCGAIFFETHDFAGKYLLKSFMFEKYNPSINTLRIIAKNDDTRTTHIWCLERGYDIDSFYLTT